MNNILLDTNLLIYAIDEDSKYYNSVQNILFAESNNLFTTSKNISEFLSVVTRYPDKSISIKDALVVINEFKSIFTILYPSEQSNLIFFFVKKIFSTRT